MYVVFSDIDGTMIPSKETNVSDQTLADIAKAQAKGLELVIATGNGTFGKVKELAEKVKARFLITSSGASIYDMHLEEHIHLNFLNEIVVTKLCDIARKYDHSSFWAWNESQIFSRDMHEISFLIRNSIDSKMEVLTLDDIDGKLLKFDFFAPPEVLDQITEELSDVDVKTERLKSTYLEVTARGSGKGNGIKHFCNIKEIDLSKTMGVGDSLNDHSMFEVVEHAYAMDNSDQITKERAHHHTADVKQNGMGMAIVDFMNRMKID